MCALRNCVVSTFRNTYVQIGALRGERIQGMRDTSEEEVSRLTGAEGVSKAK